MKKILLFLLFPVFVSAQVRTSFNGKLNIFSSTDLGGNMHQITGLFNDENGLYSSSDVEVGDFVYVSNGASCARLRVGTINSDIGGIINADVFDVDAVLAASPTGICAIMRETPTFDYPVYVAGISQSLLSCIQTHFAILADNVTVSGSGGGTTAVTIVQNSHGFSPGSPIVFDGIWALPTNDTMIAVYVVVDSIHEDTFTAAASGTFDTDIADGYYYQFDGSYSTTADTIITPLFVVADGKLTVNPLRGYDFGDYATTWLKTELEAGTPVSIAADTTTFDITGLERARFIANRIGNYTYSSRMYNTNTPNAGMYVTSNRNGTVNRIEIDTFKTRLAAYSTTAQTELAFYHDSLTLKMTSDTPSVGQVLTASSIASDGITANLKWEDLASALSRDLNTTPLVPSLTNYSIPFQLSNITDANYTVTGDTAFTVATAGVYEITFAGSFTMASGAALVIALDITKNGTGIGRNKGVYVNTTISPITITKIVSCAAGDVIKVRIASIDLTGRSLNVDAGSNLTIKKLK